MDMKLIKVSVLSALLISANAFAISAGIRSDRDSECAIWLCLPGGFPAGCEAAHSAFIKRVTDVGYHGMRKYTDLPAFSYCEDQDPPEVSEYLQKNNMGKSNITYSTVYEIHMPAFNTCNRWDWKYRKPTNEERKHHGCDKYEQGTCYIKDYKYCAAVVTTPARDFESNTYLHTYKTIKVGARAYEENLRAPYNSVSYVLVDGQRVGEKYTH